MDIYNALDDLVQEHCQLLEKKLPLEWSLVDLVLVQYPDLSPYVAREGHVYRELACLYSYRRWKRSSYFIAFCIYAGICIAKLLQLVLASLGILLFFCLLCPLFVLKLYMLDWVGKGIVWNCLTMAGNMDEYYLHCVAYLLFGTVSHRFFIGSAYWKSMEDE